MATACLRVISDSKKGRAAATLFGPTLTLYSRFLLTDEGQYAHDDQVKGNNVIEQPGDQ